ncbi:MAG: DUF3090 family protein [Dehalococcoidia bacterium]
MTFDFGIAGAVDAQAFGQPGQRTFRLRLVGAAGQSASLWLEKEQLQALSLALRQMLAQLVYAEDPPAASIDDFPAVADHDFRVGRMGMGFEPADRTVIVFAYEVGVEDEDDPTLRVRFTQEQSAALGQRLDEVIAGGRPVCALCGLPVDSGGHMCVRSNGHSKQPIPDEESDDEES